MTVVYINVGEYLRQFIRSEFGDPVVLPADWPLTQILYDNIRPNKSCVPLCPFCISQRIANASRSISDAISEYDPEKYVAIVLPQFVVREKRKVMVDDTWQLDVSATGKFRKELKRQFWTSLERYRDDLMFVSHYKQAQHYNREEILREFMGIHNIPVDFLPSLYRQWHRVGTLHAADGYNRIEQLQKRCLDNIKSFGERAPFWELKKIKLSLRNAK